MKQLLAALIFGLMAFVALSGAAPNYGSIPPLQRAVERVVECIHWR